MKDLINEAVEFVFTAICIFIGFTLLAYGVIVAIHVGFILSSHLGNYSNLGESKTCQVIK